MFTFLGLFLKGPWANLDFDGRNWVDGVCPLECLCAALRHPNVIEQALFNKALEGTDGVLDRDLVIHTGTLEKVKSFLAAKGSVDGINAASKVLGPIS